MGSNKEMRTISVSGRDERWPRRSLIAGSRT